MKAIPQTTSAAPITLTPGELEKLNDYKTPKRQIQWLRDRRWRFELSDAGRPKVDRTYYLMKMGVGSDAVPEEKPLWEAARGTKKAKRPASA